MPSDPHFHHLNWKAILKCSIGKALEGSGGWAIQERSLPLFIFQELMREGVMSSLKQFPQNIGAKLDKALWPGIKNSERKSKNAARTHVSIHPDMALLIRPFSDITPPQDGRFNLMNFSGHLSLVAEFKSTMNYNSTKPGSIKSIPKAVCRDLATVIALSQELKNSNAQFLCVFINRTTNKYRGDLFTENHFREIWDAKWHQLHPSIYQPFDYYRENFLIVN